MNGDTEGAGQESILVCGESLQLVRCPTGNAEHFETSVGVHAPNSNCAVSRAGHDFIFVELHTIDTVGMAFKIDCGSVLVLPPSVEYFPGPPFTFPVRNTGSRGAAITIEIRSMIQWLAIFPLEDLLPCMAGARDCKPSPTDQLGIHHRFRI